MSQVIKRVLDQFFEAQEGDRDMERERNKEEMSTPEVQAPEMAGWEKEMVGFDDLEWLNSIDWTQGPYVEFNGV